jgi:hypothetical protein
MIETVAWNGASCVVSPVLLVCVSITVVVMTYINAFLQRFVYGNTVAGQVLYSMDRIEDSTVCYNMGYFGKRAFGCFFYPLVSLQEPRITVDVRK